jgi:hypothetical protein
VTISRARFALVLAVSLATAPGCAGAKSAPHASPAQSLRTCVDRWNQANMRGWGPAFVRISVRRLDANELVAVGLQNPALARCVVSVAFATRAASGKCSEGAPVPGNPGWCFETRGTFACAINRFGAYNCPVRHEYLGPRLTNGNAMTDTRGVLTLEHPLTGTHATPLLAWQRRYPHVDGYIEPWTRSGTLRPGISFQGTERGACILGSEQAALRSSAKCSNAKHLIFDPCFVQGRLRVGGVGACTNQPGSTTFLRWMITGIR